MWLFRELLSMLGDVAFLIALFVVVGAILGIQT